MNEIPSREREEISSRGLKAKDTKDGMSDGLVDK